MTENAPEAIAEQPVRRVLRDGVEYVLLGTAHVSRASAEAVRRAIAEEHFDAIAVELCGPRANALLNPDSVAKMDIWQVIREGRAAVVGAGLALGAYQRRLAKQFGIEPGEEMKVAMAEAEARGVPHWLVDRDVGITLRRTRGAIGFWERAKLTAGLMASVIDDSEIEEESIEKLKQGDMLAGTFGEFAKQSPQLYESIIGERDRYMAARLREESAKAGFGANASNEMPQRVLAVVGAGHLDGLAKHLVEEDETPQHVLQPLRKDPPPSSAGKWIGAGIIAALVAIVAYGFSKDPEMGVDLLSIWAVTLMVFGALGAAAGGGHPLSIVASAISSPITPIVPVLASGMVSGAVELWLRKPTVGDFDRLRHDVTEVKGWYRNRVSRVLLVFFFSNLGTSLGVYVGGVLMARRAVT